METPHRASVSLSRLALACAASMLLVSMFGLTVSSSNALMRFSSMSRSCWMGRTRFSAISGIFELPRISAIFFRFSSASARS
ncbi:hypothetical protein D3C87_1694460 [compost metagenome]